MSRQKRLPLSAAIALLSAVPAFAAAPVFAAAPTSELLLASANLETVVVTANRQAVPLREVTASMSVLDRNDIDERGAIGVSDLLRTLPGINASNNGGAGKATALRIRGEESFRTLVLIDGINVSDTTATQVSPRFEDLMSGGIERIEVLRGPQGMMYGADAGGIVSITSRRAEQPLSAEAAVEYGSYESTTTFANVSGKSDNIDYSAYVNHFETDGFNARSNDLLGDDDGYLNTTAHLYGGIQISDEFRLEATAHNIRSENEYDSFGAAHYLSDFDFFAYRGAAIFDNEFTRQSLAYQETKSVRENFADEFGDGENLGRIHELQYQGIFRFADAGDIVYGADVKEETLKAPDESQTERDQLGYYAEWQGHVAKQIYYTLGARHDDNDDFGEITSYRASAAYLIDFAGGDVLKLKTSYSTGFRAPSLYEVAYNRNEHFGTPASNVELSEEKSEGVDAGVEYHWQSGGNLEVVYFDQTIEDEITFDLVTFSGYLQDSGLTHSRGVEVSGSYPIADNLTLLGNYTYNDTEDPNDDQRLRRPRHVANLGFEAKPVERLTVFANLRMVRDAEDEIFGVGRVPLDDYSSLQASINWSVTPQFDVYLRGENLLRDDYQEVITYNTPKEAVYAGVRAHFR